MDKDDTVRYFTPGKERIFDRSRAILGRKVQYCHPPKSVHIVNQIVKDFKAGKQDRARFWINMGGRLIYICYYAVRDAKGEYLGTLEVTQDLSEVRSLDGERRLLAYDERERGGGSMTMEINRRSRLFDVLASLSVSRRADYRDRAAVQEPAQPDLAQNGRTVGDHRKRRADWQHRRSRTGEHAPQSGRPGHRGPAARHNAAPLQIERRPGLDCP